MIVKAGRTRRRHLSKSMDMLGRADAPIVGAVLNDAGRHVRYGYYQRYGKGKKGSRYYGRGRDPRPVPVTPVSTNGNGSGGKVGTPLQSPPES
jgi:Mrp family chromosome partitioning ATPase